MVGLCLAKRSQLLELLDSKSFRTFVQLGLSLKTHDATSPLSDQVGVVVVLFVGDVGKEAKLRFVRLSNAGQANASGILLVDKGPQTGLVLDNHERNLHLSAKGRHPHHEFNRIDVAGNQDQLGLLFFDQGGHMLQAELHNMRGLARRFFLSCGLGSSSLLDTLLLGSRGLGAVLVEQGKDGHGLVLSQRLGELVDGRRDLQPLVEDGTLTLDANILGPLNETTQVTTLRANIASNPEVTGPRRVEGVDSLDNLGSLFLLL